MMDAFYRRCPLFGSLETEIRQAVEASPFREEMAYLYTIMPLSDAADYPPALLERYAQHGHFLRENTAWCRELDKELYQAYVLCHRINSEDITDCRELLYRQLWPRIAGKTLEEAILAVNYWCLEEATYRFTDQRTASPLTVLRCGFGRCGEESTLAVSALRSVGIPARQVYAPRWSHCDDNHAWVEVYCRGGWHYLGACEPEEMLDRGWFTAAASRAMLVHSRSFGTSPLPGEISAGREGCLRLWNQLPRYADCVRLTVTITQNGKPLPGVTVMAQVLNEASFQTIACLETDSQGQIHLEAGLGMLHLHCVQKGRFLRRMADLRHERQVALDFSHASPQQTEDWRGTPFSMHPPADNMHFLRPQSEALRRQRQQKFDAATAKRHEKERRFWTETYAAEQLVHAGYAPNYVQRGGKLLSHAYGNAEALFSFLTGQEDTSLALALLEQLSEKDLRDCPIQVLEETLRYAPPYEDFFPPNLFFPYVLSPRIGLEMLRPWREAIIRCFSTEERYRFRANPPVIGEWIAQHIHFHPAEEYGALYTTPAALLSLRSGSPASQDILFVAICRTLGVPARLSPESGRPQYWSSADGLFQDADISGISWEAPIPFRLFCQENTVWQYGLNWSLARLEEGAYVPLDFRHIPWQGTTLSLPLPPGNYRLLTCKRLPSGAIFAREYRFAHHSRGNGLRIAAAQTRLADLLCEMPIPDFPLYTGGGAPLSAAALCRGKKTLLLWLEEGKEPTEHILNEMLENAAAFSALPIQILFVLRTPESRQSPKIADVLSRIPSIRVFYDDFRDNMAMLARRMYIDPERLPILVLCRENLVGMYASSGYQVGLGSLVLDIFQELTGSCRQQ